ncbi:MAG: hypothetical protein PUP90_28160 [Nostoc sp. S4]|nr:hypothetical protein [Nostoc sp. S4]
MNEKIKIIMLGGTGSGKTCYMLAMYAAMQMGRHGFTISTVDPDENVRLNNLWENLIGTQGRDRWPEGTIEIKNYIFEFTEGLNSSIIFEWLDYRGGAMSEEATNNEVAELRRHIAESSGFFLCISGEDLRYPITDNSLVEVMVKTKARFMTDYLVQHGKNISREDRQYFPVIITITKFDLCYHRTHSELIEDIKRIFPPLFNLNSHWFVMICPVTLGISLAQNGDTGKIFPQNIHFPLIFALYCQLAKIGKLKEERLNEDKEIIDDWFEQNFFIRLFQSRKNREISDLENKIEEIENSLGKIDNLLMRIVKELNDTEANIYFNGTEVGILMI